MMAAVTVRFSAPLVAKVLMGSRKVRCKSGMDLLYNGITLAKVLPKLPCLCAALNLKGWKFHWVIVKPRLHDTTCCQTGC